MNKQNGNPKQTGDDEHTVVSQPPDPAMRELRHPKHMQSFGREALGQVVVQWRMTRGLSAAELADDAGCSIEVVKQIERGDALPSTRHLLTLAELMELSFEKLLRLVGIVRVEDDALITAALRYLALTSNQSLDSEVARDETHSFLELLRDTRSQPAETPDAVKRRS